MSRKERIILFILACLNFTHILDFMIMMPLGNYLMPYFGMSTKFFSLIVAAYPVTACISGLIAAFYVDRFDRKKVLLFAYTGFIIGTISCGIAPGPGLLMAARILTGLFGGLIGAQVLSIIADIFPYEKRGQAMGTIFMAFSVASIAGVPFSLYLASLISWHAPFIFIGILGIALVPFIIRFLPPMKIHLAPAGDTTVKPPVTKVLGDIIRNKPQITALFMSGILFMGHFMIIPFINPYMEFNMGFSKTQTPLIYMIGGSFTLVSSFLIGKLSDKYGKFRIFTICLFCSLVPVLFITNMPAIPFVGVLAIFAIWFVFSSGRNIPAQAMITTVVNPAQRGQFMSFISSFQQLFTGLASIIAGMIVVEGAHGKIQRYSWVGYLSVTIVASTFFIARSLARQQQLH
ncbi:MFS transporter [Paraflavitalea sp. CAU 1676]|uniref:MFS transporter n=1 Tax=Paraflavitalea sp. CAU 1676 TaxID=3032598 RepID=UPI0023DB8950|nr:MFS transporter [Paraflavitalea sp. CAU 1676]MDF2189450.1 MFS transporter [Paraflavitalea sp. CAU 1676]